MSSFYFLFAVYWVLKEGERPIKMSSTQSVILAIALCLRSLSPEPILPVWFMSKISIYFSSLQACKYLTIVAMTLWVRSPKPIFPVRFVSKISIYFSSLQACQYLTIVAMQADQCNSHPEVLLICFLINIFLIVGSELSVATSNNSCYASLRQLSGTD